MERQEIQQKMMDRKEQRTPNSTFAIGGVSCSGDSFVVTESSVLVHLRRIVLKIPPIANLQNVKPAYRKAA